MAGARHSTDIRDDRPRTRATSDAGTVDLPVRSTTELREVAAAPRCAIRLHGVRIELDAGAGAVVRASGAPRTVRIQADLPPQVVRAARYAHRYAFHLAEAALLDMAAVVGHRVPHFEQALDEAARLAG